MKRNGFKKCVALFLAALLVFTSLSLMASAASGYTPTGDFYKISETEYKIAPGVTENRLVINKTSGDQQEMVYAVTLDTSNPNVGIMAGYADYPTNPNSFRWKMQKVRDQAAAAQNATGANVVAAFNADIFNMQTGEPTGCLVMGGNIFKEGLGRPYFGVTKTGGYVMGESLTEEILHSLREGLSGFYMIVKDGVRTGPGLNPESNVAPKTAIGMKADGTITVVCVDGRNQPISCNLSDYDLATIMMDLGCVNVLNLDGGGSTTYLAKYEGKTALELANKPSDAVERQVATSLLVVSTARPSGEFDHAALTPNNTLYTPGTTVAFNAIGVDSAGGSAPLPADGSFALAADSAALGSITPEGLFTAGDGEGVVTVNYMSGGAAVGSTTIEIAVPDEFYIPSDEYSLDFDETTDFGIVAKNAARTVTLKDGDILWSAADENGGDVTNEIGSFNGLSFTARGAGSAEATVTVQSFFDSAVSATLKAVIGSAPVMLYDFEYTDDPAKAEASGGRLKYIPSMELPTYDKNTNISYYEFGRQWREEGYPLFSWPNNSLGVSGMKSTVISAEDGEPVRFGEHALRIDVDFSSYDKSSNANNYLRVTEPSHFFEGSPKKMSAWVYCPEGVPNFALYLNCATKNLNNYTQYPSAGTAAYSPVSVFDSSSHATNWVGWKYVEIDLANAAVGSSNIGAQNYPYGFYESCGVFWISYQPGNHNGDKAAGTFYIDNIQLIYSSNTDDTKNPEVTSIRYDTLGAPEEFVSGSTVLADNTLTIRASYKDAEDKYMTGVNPEQVTMAVDGKDVTDRCFINAGDEEIYLYDAVLGNGAHSVSVTVYDNFGNKTTETRYFTVEGENDAKGRMAAEQSNPVLGADYVIDILADSPADLAAAAVDVHTFALFTSYYGNVRVEPAEGFALDGEARYDRTNAIISFRLAKDGEAVPEDGVIARIVYSIPSDVPADSIDVAFRLDKGDLTYTNADNEKVLDTFGGRIDTSCIAPLVVNSDVFLVGAEGGSFYVRDLNGLPVEGAKLYYSDGTPFSETLTDADGKLFTDAFAAEAMNFSVYAEKDGLLSFIYTSQSYLSGGDEEGWPTSIALNGAADGSTMINLSWFASPAAADEKAVAQFAEKAAYDAGGEEALISVEGVSRTEELASTGNVVNNKALLFNKVVISGLKPDTEYVYKVGDGTRMSALRTFKTGKKAVDTDFFVIGDMQDEDTSNLDAILASLSDSAVNYAFGIQTGDAVDNGGMYKWWVNVASIFSAGYLNTRPIVHVLGNHEYYGDLEGENSADYFGMTTADGKAPLAYSSENGSVYVAVINYAGASSYEEAVEWVKNDAAASRALWKVLAIHQPAYYTNPGGGNAGANQLIPPLVDEAGFNVVFSGHDHSYVRTYPVTGGQRDDENGAVYYICGSTGEKSYAVVENGSFPFDFVRGSGAVEGEYNAIYLTAHATDTEMTIDTHEVFALEGGAYTDDVIDSCTIKRAVTCSASGEHVFSYAADTLTCTVCGYSKPLGNYTGMATDAQTGSNRYFVNGSTKTGWQILGEDCYYFDENGRSVPAGKRTIDGVKYTFDADGKQVGGAFVKTADGYTRCYRGGNYLTGWNEIDGKTYFFSTSDKHPGKMLTGTSTIVIYTGQKITYNFASDGHLLDYVFVKEDGGTRCYWGRNPQTGLQVINGKTYYFDPATALMQTGEIEIDGTVYSFGSDGALRHEGPHNYEYTGHQEMSCTQDEADIYTCTICGETKTDVINPTPGHVDADKDDLCDVCGIYYKAKLSFFERIIRFFIKIRNWFMNLFKVG